MVLWTFATSLFWAGVALYVINRSRFQDAQRRLRELEGREDGK